MALSRYIAHRLIELHLALEADQDLLQTSKVRGQITELRLLEVELDGEAAMPQIAGAGVPIV